MKAYRLHEWKNNGRLDDISVPEPGPGQVLLKIAGNGICGSDLHIMDEWEGPPPHLKFELPITLGHEIAGWVEQPGPSVEGFERGQPVLVTVTGCERCHMCAAGWNNYCVNSAERALASVGGLAEYMVAPANGLVLLHKLTPWKAAPLTDAGLTSYHCMRRVQHLLTPDATVFVIGLGGLGHMAVEMIKQTTATKVIGADPNPAARKLAEDRGADLLLPSDQDTLKTVLEVVGPRRVDAVLDFVGMKATMEMACKAIRPMGEIVVAGRGHNGIEFMHNTMPYGATIRTTFGGSKLELMQIVALAEAGKLQSHVTKYDLSDVQTAIDKLRAGEIVGRAVVVPDGH
jgi:propanol-preferring alcohol dehydrogenase